MKAYSKFHPNVILLKLYDIWSFRGIMQMDIFLDDRKAVSRRSHY
jgi:hypothetical protein